MKGFIELGTTKIQDNYEGISYLFEVTDYVLLISGNTYNHKEQLKATGYKWNPSYKYWYKNFVSIEELRSAYNAWNDSSEGLVATVRSIYRQVRPM